MSATKTTTLLDLAQNFDKYMFGSENIPTSPITKGFSFYGNQIISDDVLFWEILDVKEDGTYPCVILGTSDSQYFDQDSKIIIHHISSSNGK